MTELTLSQENNDTVLNAPVHNCAPQPLDSKLIQKLREKFTEQEQQLFVQNFCMYLNYDKTRDYVIDLDKVWQWMGFSRKDPAKRVLDTHFTEGTDYIVRPHPSVVQVSETVDGKGNSRTDQNRETVVAPGQLRLQPSVEQVSETVDGQGNSRTDQNSATVGGTRQHGGHNREQVMMNIKTFKRMCMKANTKRASDIHDYYITMEETLQEYIHETFLEREQQSKLEQKRITTDTLVESFHLKAVNYFGVVGTINNQLLGKFGYTKDIKTRMSDHRRDIGKHFGLDCILECERNDTLEKLFKQYICDRKVTAVINGKKQTELIKLDNSFGPDEVMKVYRLLKQTIEASINSEKELLTLQIELLRAQNALKQTELETKRLEYLRSEASASTSTTYHETPQRAPQRVNGQVVSQYTLDGRLVQQHSSFAAAAKAVYGDRNTLAKRCKANSAYKEYMWKCE
ncbi:hypothetical protein EBZ38_15160 [bacterium]|nr:hypothetical protein [bacterium]NDC96118.1 hypothetical protein [bacterium]NDD85599.1 hypothetical protein [bacterium]NDG19751.1 hypothetical protein [Betaproteobacteria bacterium]